MPKLIRDPVSPITVGLRRAERDFLERVGVGDNFGAKLRSVLRRCMETFDAVAGTPGAILAYRQGDGEKEWSKDIPFPVKKSDGWQAIDRAARDTGYVCQIIENKEAGTVEVWTAPSYKLNNCDACRRRVAEAMYG